MNTSRDDLLKRIQAIKKMAEESPHEEERDTAHRLLLQLVEKYNVDVEEIEGEEPDVFVKFYYRSGWELTLLTHTYCWLAQKNQMSYRIPNNSRSNVYVRCKPSEKELLKTAFKFYRDAYYRELELFQQAYLNAHGLFGPRNPDKEPKPSRLTDEERNRLFAMINGIQTLVNPLTHLIEEGDPDSELSSN